MYCVHNYLFIVLHFSRGKNVPHGSNTDVFLFINIIVYCFLFFSIPNTVIPIYNDENVKL